MIDINVVATVTCDDCGAVVKIPEDISWVDCEAVEMIEAVVYALDPHMWKYDAEGEEVLCPKCVAKRGN
jgi:hypothetical protein